MKIQMVWDVTSFWLVNSSDMGSIEPPKHWELVYESAQCNITAGLNPQNTEVHWRQVVHHSLS
jgi:hypothetical protein